MTNTRKRRMCSYCACMNDKFLECPDCGIMICHDCLIEYKQKAICCDCFAAIIVRIPIKAVHHATA